MNTRIDLEQQEIAEESKETDFEECRVAEELKDFTIYETLDLAYYTSFIIE